MPTGQVPFGYVWDPVQKKWVPPNPAGNTLLDQGSTPQGSSAGQSPSGQTPYVVPPAQGNAGPGYVPPPANAPVTTMPPTQTPSILSQTNFDAELEKILGQGNQPTALEESIMGDMNIGDFTADDQKILDDSIQLARGQAAIRDKQAENTLAASGLRGGGSLVKEYARTTNELAEKVLQASISVRTAAANRNASAREAAMSRAASFAKAIRDGNAQLAQALLSAYATDRQAELDANKQAFEKQMFEESLALSRDKFTEEQRAAMVAEGFTADQIATAETQLQWQNAFNERQQMAEIGLAQKNYELQNKSLDASISQADRALSMQEIKNNADISLADRTFELTKQFGLSDRAFDREKFEAYTAQLEREFGLQLNQFALEKMIRTGELDLNILNSQRRYDLDKEDQKQKWLATEAARQTQEKLGMTELEIRQALGEGELSIAREQQILEKYMFDAGLNWEKAKFKQQLEAARKRSKGGLLGKILKTVVGVGMGVAGVVTGNPALIAAGATTVFGGSSGDFASVMNTVAGETIATPSAGGGTTVSQGFGNVNNYG